MSYLVLEEVLELVKLEKSSCSAYKDLVEKKKVTR